MQFITDLQRHLLGGLLQEVVEAVQMALGFVAKDLQQHWVMGLGGRRCSATGQGMGTGGQGVDFIALALVVASEIGDQLRQQGHGLIQHLPHLRAKDYTAFQHAIEQVLHGPGQLGQHQGAHHAAAALEGMESPAHFALGGFVRAVGQVAMQHVEDFIGFFKEDFAQFIVNRFFTGRRRQQATGTLQGWRVET